MQFQHALLSIINKAIAEPGGELAADLAAIGVILPGAEPDEIPTVGNYLSGICMAALSGGLVGAAAMIVADFFRGDNDPENANHLDVLEAAKDAGDEFVIAASAALSPPTISVGNVTAILLITASFSISTLRP